MSRIPISLAMSDSDHVRDLVTGHVPVEGLDVTYLTHEVEEIFFRFTRYREWDAAEMSMGKYCALRASGDDSLVGLPIFLSRLFRHSGIFVRKDGPIHTPADIAKARVGIPEWTVTATIYQRALLVHEYGLDLAAIAWTQGGVNEAGRQETLSTSTPPGVVLQRERSRTLNDMLIAGDIDVIMAPRPPRGYTDGSGRIVSLFEDAEQVERDYFERTGVFPIMHLLALRRDVFEEHPWVARNLVTAFTTAKNNSIARLSDLTSSPLPLPWVAQQVSTAVDLFGADPWPYGVAANQTTLQSFLRYAFEQRVCERLLDVPDLFPASVREGFAV